MSSLHEKLHPGALVEVKFLDGDTNTGVIEEYNPIFFVIHDSLIHLSRVIPWVGIRDLTIKDSVIGRAS